VEKKRKLIVLGDSAFAEIAYEYFTCDSEYEVVGFAVEREFLKRDALFGLPVIAFESLADRFAPEDHSFFAATVYTQKNQLRARLYRTAKEQGYRPASYISSRAFVWRNCKIGEHCFIFEHNVVQPFVSLGNNIVLWSGNHIGHHSTVDDNCFVSSHVVISGFCRVGANCFLGVNATIANNLTVGPDCTVGANALILGDVPANQTVVGVWKKNKEASST
jgi:sugar O-acyltransferase (sialic acid O-acetyltransferase NeuD family)